MKDHDTLRVRVAAPAALAVAAVLAHGCSKEPSTDAKADPPSKPGEAAPATAVAPPPEPTPLDRIQRASTLAEALAVSGPLMSDTRDEQSAGTILLTVWAAAHLQWSDVAVARNETSFALVKKDSDEARGKRMCASGQLIQIAKQDVGNDKVYSGLLITGNSDLLSFFAAGTTGALVERSRARFCGIVTGTYDYANSGGGVGHAIAAVGMFDLPGNRQPP